MVNSYANIGRHCPHHILFTPPLTLVTIPVFRHAVEEHLAPHPVPTQQYPPGDHSPLAFEQDET